MKKDSRESRPFESRKVEQSSGYILGLESRAKRTPTEGDAIEDDESTGSNRPLESEEEEGSEGQRGGEDDADAKSERNSAHPMIGINFRTMIGKIVPPIELPHATTP